MTVRDVFLTHGKAYLDAFGQRMLAHHKKVMQEIIQCRTPDLGTIVCACEDCANTYRIFRSCGNRHCPTCQGEKATQWLNTRIDQLMPVHHFMITCTVPAAAQGFFPVSSTFCVCGVVSCNFEDDERTRRRVYVFLRRHSRILRRSPYVGQADAVSSAYSLCCSRWSLLIIRPQLALFLRGVLPAG